MTYEEFKIKAKDSQINEKKCVYLIREYFIDDFSELFKNGTVKCSQPIMGFARNLTGAKRMIRKFYEDISDEAYKPYRAFFTIYACISGVLTNFECGRFNKAARQSWSANYKAQIIEHCIINAHFYGKSNRDNHFKKGTQVGVLFPNSLIVELGVITQTPPSIKELWESREEVRLHYKYMGLRFSESEWQHDNKCPKDFYRVMVADKEIDVRSSLLIPLPDPKKL